MSDKLDKMPSDQIKVSVKGKTAKAKPADESEMLAGRDTIYVDTDDDITSIIEKVKGSANSVVALVPPARIGVLQSVVNLKLLQRAAKTSRKKISLITNDRALVALAAGLKIPVAKSVNAQAEIPVSDVEEMSENDVIDGNDLAIGELAKLVKTDASGATKPHAKDEETSAAVAAIETDDKIKNDRDADGEPDDAPTDDKPKKSRKVAIKVPDFNAFRKKVLIFAGLGICLIAFFVWAIIFAPHGTITVKAQTTDKDVAATVTLSSANTDISSNVVNSVVKQKKNSQTLEFDATGTKDVGEKATGTVVIYNTNSIAPLTIAAGTTLASGSLYYTLNENVSVPGVTGTLTDPKAGTSKAVSVTAANIGSEYNIDEDTTLSISGYTAKVYAVPTKAFSGGSKDTVKVVQQSDIDLATEKLKNQVDANKIKDELNDQMGDGATAIPDSFSVSYGTFSSNPAAGAAPESGKRPVLSVEITYTLIGVSNDDLNAVLNAQLSAQLAGAENQKVYSNGFKTVKFKNFQAAGDGFSVSINATGSVGPKLDENQIKNMAINKRSGEIREALTKISGVNDVEVQFSPFWVSSISDAKKLTVNFAIDE